MASSAASTSRTRSRCSSGPRSWSQYRTRADSCRIAVTPASARARRCCASAAGPPAPGSTAAVNAARPEPAAVASRLMPPGGAVTRRASPPAAGSSHRARWPAGSPAGSSSGTRRRVGWPRPGRDGAGWLPGCWPAPGWPARGWPARGWPAPGWPARCWLARRCPHRDARLRAGSGAGAGRGGAGGQEDQRAVRQEGRTVLPFRGPGQPHRGPPRTRIHPPDAGLERPPVGGEGRHRHGQPAAVRGEPQATEPRQGQVVVQVVEWGHCVFPPQVGTGRQVAAPSADELPPGAVPPDDGAPGSLSALR